MRRKAGYFLITGIFLGVMLACALPSPPQATPVVSVTAMDSPESTVTPGGEVEGPSPNLTPFLFAALAGLLFVATGVAVYLLIRKTPQQTSVSTAQPSSAPHHLDTERYPKCSP